MIVGALEAELRIPGCRSLKEKRLILRSLKDRLRNRFNLAVSETAHQDLWQRATLSLVTVSSDRKTANSVLQKAERLIENEPRVSIIDAGIEWR